jgi:hypothetical protein
VCGRVGPRGRKFYGMVIEQTGLRTLATADEQRNDIEFYRRRDEIEVWMPVS